MAADDDTYDISDDRDSIIDDTLDQLRQQRDDAQEIDLNGVFSVNPQMFKTGKHVIQGPVAFGTPFRSQPNITWGQVAYQNTSDLTRPDTQPSSYQPFLIQPYVYRFDSTTGAGVDQFWIGMYAITDIPDGVTNHTLHWRATGTSSPYRDQGTDDSWTDTYDYNEPDYLVDETDYGDDE